MASGIEDELDQLFVEVMAMAASLRQSADVGRGSPRLSLPARSVLKLLQGHSGLTVPQLARQRGTSRQNIQALVDRLAAAGLVEYVANPDHQRSERLQLTAAGGRALSAANRQLAAKLGGLLPDVTEEEIRSCSHLLRRIQGKLGGRRREFTTPERVRPARSGVKKSAPVAENHQIPKPTLDEPTDVSPPGDLPFNLL